MKRIILILSVLCLVFSIIACDGGSGDKIIKDDIVVVFETGIEAGFSISDEDYNKYNEIMNYLNKYPEKSEATLFEELSKTYGESSEELASFINDNMLAAIARDMASNTVTEEDINNLASKFVKENIVGNSVSVNSIDSESQGIGAISHIDLKVDEKDHNLIVKFSFSDDYKTAEVVQIKIDGINITLQ